MAADGARPPERLRKGLVLGGPDVGGLSRISSITAVLGSFTLRQAVSSFSMAVPLLERLLPRSRWHPNGNEKYWMELKSSKSSRGSG